VALGHPNRVKKTVLRHHPVDVLLVEEHNTTTDARYWETWLQACPMTTRPALVVVCAGPDELIEDGGFHCKSWRNQFRALGYSPGFWFLRATDFGGVVRQDRVVLLLQKIDGTFPVELDRFRPVPSNDYGKVRAATNMLKTHQIPGNSWSRQGWEEIDMSPGLVSAAAPCRIVGTAEQDGRPVFCPSASLPDGIGSWIRVTDRRGQQRLRRLLPEELAKAKGATMATMPDLVNNRAAIDSMTSVHIWTAIGDAIQAAWSAGPTSAPRPAAPSYIPASWMVEPEDSRSPDDGEWEWSPPDLSEGGEWYKDRVTSLEAAIKGHPESHRLRIEGLQALHHHRRNYGPDGPQHLQLLWWEFPREHWDELRDGCPMNFLTEPVGSIMPNQDMETDVAAIAAEFVDDLKRLGVLRALPDGEFFRMNAPLFCVKKHAGQWRPIADMKRGGQNAHIGKDPVHLPRPDDILTRMYTGGWSAVADASKFFHNFPTHPVDRPFLGCIHPTSGEQLCYFGLPMGSSSSPGLACRYGASWLRQIREREPAFQGVLVDNGWKVHVKGKSRDSHKGVCLVRMGPDGLPAAILYIHVDDILVHAPTRAKCEAALAAVMDAAVRVGLICQPCKSRPPSQIQLYCGFLYDSTGIPCLCVAPNKIDRAIASIGFLRSGAATTRLSRLTLAVVVGLLQSMVGATPYNSGQTYLRRLYDRLHSLEGVPRGTSGAAFYFTRVHLDDEEWLDLRWWERALHRGLRRYARSRAQNVLGVTWGDGSGTGTGGTFQIVPADGGSSTLEAWMGLWEPQVFHFSSNWKELRTLLHTLDRERGNERLRGCTVFYFTDNMVSYYVAHSGGSSSPELHKLLRQLKQLELELDIHLEVVHVPGRHMIDQQTDGLSRGLAFSNSRLSRSPTEELLRLFQDVKHTSELIPWVMYWSNRAPDCRSLRHVEAVSDWGFSTVAGKSTVWTPAPEWADQIISFVLDFWVEQPWTTEAFFVIPRIFQRRWGRISKHIVEVAVVDPNLSPGGWDSDVPIVILHLPCFVRSLPPPSLDRTAQPHGPKWHTEQALHVRGL